MKPRIRDLVDKIWNRYVATGQSFDLKEVVEEVIAIIEAGEAIDDPVSDRVWKDVRDRDKRAKQAHGSDEDQLTFAEFTFPEVLVIADNERRATFSARLQEVLADQSVKTTAKLREDTSYERLLRRNNEIMPYLIDGMNVTDAIDSWKRDHEEPAA